MIPSFFAVQKSIVRNSLKLLLAICCIFYLSACQDPIVVGSDLLDDEKIDLGFVDTLRLSSKTIGGKKVATYRRLIDSRTYLTGQLLDPVFGKVTAEIYFEPYLNSPKPAFTDAILDSMVMSLTLDSLGTYGQKSNSFNVELFQLATRMPIKDTIYSNEAVASDKLLGSINTIINAKDSITVFDHVTKKNIRQPAQLRIKIDQAWAQDLFDNSTAQAQDTTFIKTVKGFALKAQPIGAPGLFGINLSNAAVTTVAPTNKLVVYYHKKVADTIQRLSYIYPIATNTVNNYVIDRTGSKAEELIANPSLGNNQSLLQGLGGVKTSITFDNLSFLKDKKISKVELDIFAGLSYGQNEAVSLPLQLVASRYNTIDSLELIPDILQLTSQNISFSSVFGGSLNKTGVAKYTLNITNHVKQILADSTYKPELILGILTESEIASQTVLYGAKHPVYPMKLRVTYAK